MFEKLFEKNFSFLNYIGLEKEFDITFKCMIGKLESKFLIKNVVTIAGKEVISIMELENNSDYSLEDYLRYKNKLKNIKDCSFQVEISPYLFIPIHDLILTTRTESSLKESNFLFIGDLIVDDNLNYKNIFLGDLPLKIPNFGKGCHKELTEQLNRIGINKTIDFDKNLYYLLRKIHLSKINI